MLKANFLDTFSDHKKLSEDDSSIDVDGLCPSVEPSFDDIVYRRVSVKFDDFDSDDFEFALDYKTGVFSVKDEDATWLVDTMAALDYQKSSGLDICYTSEIDDDMGLYMMAVFLPPKNAEKIGTKTVSGRECQQYESFSTFDLFGNSYTFRFIHCVADRFVLETEEFFEGETYQSLFTDHKKLSEDDSSVNIEGFCLSVVHDFVFRQVLL
ncbi:hypothetical protein GEMRC1_011261 [Eukaryota sp. GEM-RC1]